MVPCYANVVWEMPEEKSNHLSPLFDQTLSASLTESSEVGAERGGLGTGSTRGVVTAEDEKQVRNKYSRPLDERNECQSTANRKLKIQVLGVR